MVIRVSAPINQFPLLGARGFEVLRPNSQTVFSSSILLREGGINLGGGLRGSQHMKTSHKINKGIGSLTGGYQHENPDSFHPPPVAPIDQHTHGESVEAKKMAKKRKSSEKKEAKLAAGKNSKAEGRKKKSTPKTKSKPKAKAKAKAKDKKIVFQKFPQTHTFSKKKGVVKTAPLTKQEPENSIWGI